MNTKLFKHSLLVRDNKMTNKYRNELTEKMKRSALKIQEDILNEGRSFRICDKQGNIVDRARVNGKIIDKLVITKKQLIDKRAQ